MPHGLSAKTLREPIIPHYTQTYDTLISIVQGVALGLLLTDNRALLDVDLSAWAAWLKSLTTAMIIGVVWHRYVTHNQFLAWRPRLIDSLLPTLLAVAQMALALSVNQKPGRFSFWIFAVALLSTAAYQNTIWRFRGGDVLPTLKEVVGPDASPLFAAITEFQFRARREVLGVTLLFALAWAIAARGVLDTGGEAVVDTIIVGAVCSWLFVNDLPNRLGRLLHEHEAAG